MKQNKLSNFNENIIDLKDGFVDALRYSFLDVAIIGTISLGILGYNAHKKEYIESQIVPIQFSEIGQLKKEAKKLGIELSTINIYLPEVNDLYSKVFEANNEAYYLGVDINTSFARELENHMKLKNIYHFNLRDLLHDVPELSKQLLIEKEEYIRAQDIAVPLADASRNSWSDYHDDNYHTEYYTETEYYTDTDSDGNSVSKSRQVSKSREVYDDTDHYFNYDAKQGILTDNLGKKFLKEIPTLKLKAIYVASKTNADGEYAAEKSRIFQKKNSFNELDYLDFSRNWFFGSTILHNAKRIEELQRILPFYVRDWNKSKKTSTNFHENTTSKVHDGPEEFQMMKSYVPVATNLKNNLDEFVTSIEKTRDGSIQLEKMIDTYIHDAFIKPDSISSRKHERNVIKQRKEIISFTKELYFSTFKKGFGMRTYNYGRVVLKSLAGLVIGAAIGLGINYLGDKTNMYNYLDSKKPLNKQNRNRRGAQNDVFRDYRRGL